METPGSSDISTVPLRFNLRAREILGTRGTASLPTPTTNAAGKQPFQVQRHESRRSFELVADPGERVGTEEFAVA